MHQCMYCGVSFDIALEIDWHVAGDEFMCGTCYDFTHHVDDDIDDIDDDYDYEVDEEEYLDMRGRPCT